MIRIMNFPWAEHTSLRTKTGGTDEEDGRGQAPEPRAQKDACNGGDNSFAQDRDTAPSVS